MRRLAKRHSFELLATDQTERPLIIEIEPPDMINFRYKGCRTRYSASLHNVRMLAIANKVVEEHKVKMEVYNAKKNAGFKVKKPRKPNISMFSRKVKWILNSNFMG